MIPERGSTYAERMVRHRRFYIPATLCLFLSYPGSLASLLSSSNPDLSMAQRVETLLFYLPMVITYALLLVWAIPRDMKIFLGMIALLLPALLITLLVRTTTFSANFHLAIMRMESLVQVLPGLIMFLVLCAMDQKKRDPSIFWGLIVLIIPLSFYSARNKEAVRFFDRLRLNDVLDRVAQREWPSPVWEEECKLIADTLMRQNCLNAIAPQISGQPTNRDKQTIPTGQSRLENPLQNPLSLGSY